MPESLIMGLMWSNAEEPGEISKSEYGRNQLKTFPLLTPFQIWDLRHTCEQDEGMAGYGWAVYDIRKGGMQVINDTGNKLDLITYFSKVSDEQRSGEWGLRVKGIPRPNAHGLQKTTVVS